MTRHVKCIKCGTFNTNQEYCTNCGTPLSYEKRRQIEYEKSEKERKERELLEKQNNPSFFNRYGNHKNIIVRFAVRIIRSVWLAFMAIGTFIAWLVTAIAG